MQKAYTDLILLMLILRWKNCIKLDQKKSLHWLDFIDVDFKMKKLH